MSARGALALAAVTGVTACGFGDSGIEPPAQRIFLPAALEQSASGRWLYVVNSNSDLRFNAGTLVAVDLDAAAADRANPAWSACPTLRYVARGAPARYCCRDLDDPRLLACDDRPYVAGGATVQLGSFGSAAVAQRFARDGQAVDRLFISVRGDPSITFVDATERAAGIVLACAGTPGTPRARPGTLCDGAFRLAAGSLAPGGAPPALTRLPQEPYALTLDEGLGALYVGHLRGGVSLIDVCRPETGASPALAATQEAVFRSAAEFGVMGIVATRAGEASAPVLALPRTGLEVAELFLAGASAGGQAGQPCAAGGPGLRLVLGRTFPIASFFPRGADLRGMVLQPSRQRAFVLHRNSAGTGLTAASTAAITRLDVTAEADGGVRFRSVQAVEVCAGPVQLLAHDPGRGERLYVTCFESGQVYVVDPDRLEVVGIVDVGRGPAWLHVDRRDPGLAYVAGFADNNVAVVDLRPGSPTEHRVVQRIGFSRTSAENR